MGVMGFLSGKLHMLLDKAQQGLGGIVRGGVEMYQVQAFLVGERLETLLLLRQHRQALLDGHALA